MVRGNVAREGGKSGGCDESYHDAARLCAAQNIGWTM